MVVYISNWTNGEMATSFLFLQETVEIPAKCDFSHLKAAPFSKPTLNLISAAA